VPITDRTAISVNRRVDIVVLSTASAEANALLPSIDAAQGATP
jgi:chemotaxis protein MotB